MTGTRVLASLVCISAFTAITAASSASAEGMTVGERERLRRDSNERFDTHGLRHRDSFVTDTSSRFLDVPAEPSLTGDFTVAATPPTVRFRIVPNLEPEYFFDLTLDSEAYMIAWSNWAEVTRSGDGRFFFSVTDHRGNGCNLNIYEYSPARDIVHRVVDVKKLLGWTDHSLTDGKIHGKMGIMPDGTLWAVTHYGVDPDSSWWANGYRGSWLLSYNIFTREARNHGIPMVGNALPCFRVDTRRGLLFGTCSDFEDARTILVWDCIGRKTRYAGCPPNGWVWWDRALLLDDRTGVFWGNDDHPPYRLMSFDPALNRFDRYDDVTVPPNPFDGEPQQLRGCTGRPAADGFYYWATWNGMLCRFRPPRDGEGPVLEAAGTTWDRGRDTLQMAQSPGGRYVYYFPKSYPAPIVQYDVITGVRKALCFLQDYYHETYGYWMDHCYGLEISEDGSFLVIVMNGVFQPKGTKAFGHPSLIVVDIPESERIE